MLKRFYASFLVLLCVFNAQIFSQDVNSWYNKPIKSIEFEGLVNVKQADLDGVMSSFIGKEFTNKGYMSTAKLFKSPWGSTWTDGELVLHITSEKNIEYLDINKIFDPDEIDCEEQEEILINRNTTMILSSYKYDNKKKIYILEMNII
jgi:outer membrane protein assembly factor BamA